MNPRFRGTQCRTVIDKGVIVGTNMGAEMLSIENLHVSVDDTEIIKGLSLKINLGEVHAIMGRNGSGKSTLANVVMGHPAYEITSGTINFEGKPLDDLEVYERARAGMFLSFQYPSSIPGVQVGTFLRKSVAAVRGDDAPSAREFRKELNAHLESLDTDKSFLSRYANDGFSGGGKKRPAILPMPVPAAKLAVLAATEAAVDHDGPR